MGAIRAVRSNAEDAIARVEGRRGITALAGGGGVTVELSWIERVRVSGAVNGIQLDTAVGGNTSLAL